jgi:hypothetical protein
MVNIVYQYGRLHHGVEPAIRVRSAIAALGGVADWNPALKDWSARFDSIPRADLLSHSERVQEAVRESSGEEPRLVSIRTELPAKADDPEQGTPARQPPSQTRGLRAAQDRLRRFRSNP